MIRFSSTVALVTASFGEMTTEIVRNKRRLGIAIVSADTSGYVDVKNLTDIRIMISHTRQRNHVIVIELETEHSVVVG